jgi:hypothetical protein
MLVLLLNIMSHYTWAATNTIAVFQMNTTLAFEMDPLDELSYCDIYAGLGVSRDIPRYLELDFSPNSRHFLLSWNSTCYNHLENRDNNGKKWLLLTDLRKETESS